MTEWIKVEDKLPDTDRLVLICENWIDNIEIAYYRRGKWSTYIPDNVDVDGNAVIESTLNNNCVKAWMELPRPLTV